MTASISQRTAVGASWMIVWRFFTRGIGLASTLLLARILVPADFGLLTMAAAVAGMVDALSQVQLQDALVRGNDTGKDLYDTAFTMQAGRALLTAVIVAGLAPVAAVWFDEPRLLQVLLVIALGSMVGGLENIGIVQFRRDLRFRIQFILLALPRLIQVAVAIPLALAWQSYWALLIGTLVSKVAGALFSYAVHPHRPKLTLGRWRSLIGFSFWTWASSIALVIWTRGDPFILGATLGATSVGMFLIAGEIAALPISELVAPATNALYAGMAAAQHQGSDAIGRALPVGCMLLLAVVPLSIGLSATSGYVTAIILGPRWIDVQSLIAIFAWACVFSPLTFVATTVLTVRGQYRRNFYAVALAATIKAAAVYLAATLTHSLVIVAIAAVACQAIETIAFLFQLRGLGDLNARQSRGAVIRIALSTAMTVLLLSQTSFAWATVTLGSLEALAYGLPSGVFCVALFCLVHAALWFATGRRPGPETDLFHLAHSLAGARIRRLAVAATVRLSP